MLTAFLAVSLFASTVPSTHSLVKDLGTLTGGPTSGPGDVIAGKTFDVVPGGSLTFIAPTNQIWGLGELSATPSKGVTISQKVVKVKEPGVLGAATWYRYTIHLSSDLKSTVTIKTSGNYQTRNDKDWAFSFKISPKSARSATSASAEGTQVGRNADTRGGSPASSSGGANGGFHH